VRDLDRRIQPLGLLLALLATTLPTSLGCPSSGDGPRGSSSVAPLQASSARPPGDPPDAGGPKAPPAAERARVLWSRSFTHRGTGPSAAVITVATARDGARVIAGAVAGPVDFGGGTLPAHGVQNAFVAKLDGSGKHLWSKRFPGEGAQTITAVAVDDADNVVVTGTFDRDTDFGGGTVTSAGMIDVFVVKLDPDGKHLWSKRFGDAEEQEAGGVAVGPDGAVVVAGSFEGTIDLGGGPLASAGADDVFLVKLDATGKHLWSKRFGDAEAQHGRALGVDAASDVVLVGDAQGKIDLGGGPLQSRDATSLFLARFDARGKLVSSKLFHADPRSLVKPRAVAVERGGGAVIVGSMRGATDLGGGLLRSEGARELDAFVARFDANGGHAWSRRFGDGADQEALAVALDGHGGAVMTGRFEGTIDFGGGPLSSAGSTDVFVARLDASGAHRASARFGDPSAQQATGIAVDAAGRVAITGDLRGYVPFGANVLTGPAAFIAELELAD
jgi:hypothetical protein